MKTKTLRYILSGAVIAGTIATAVLAARAGVKAEKKINKAADESDDPLTFKDKVKAAAPSYIPTAVVATATIACEIAGFKVGSKYAAAAAAPMAVAAKMYNDYRKETIEQYGDEADRKIREAILNKTVSVDGSVAQHLDDCLGSLDPEKTYLFYIAMLDRYIEVTPFMMRNSEYEANRVFADRGECAVNYWTGCMGFEEDYFRDDVCWYASSGVMFIDFQHIPVKMSDGTEAIVVTTTYLPEANFD